MAAEAEAIDYSRYERWAPTQLRSTFTDSGYSLGLEMSARTERRLESGAAAGYSPRSPRI